MVKILNCYFYAKKVMALCLREQCFLAIRVVSFSLSKFFNLFIEQECFPESIKLSKVIFVLYVVPNAI